MLEDQDSLYTFIMVDDEPVIRNGIRDHIPWEALGFRFLASCADGTEALEMMEKTRADVIMTDICMPFMDGLALAAHIQDRYPGTKVILLTGYDDFEYAQQAVKLRVHDYVLKPITPAALRELLSSMKTRLDEERRRFQDEKTLRKQLEESLPLLQERMLNKLLIGAYPEQEIGPYLDFLGLRLPTLEAVYQILIIGVCSAGTPESSVLNQFSEKNAIRRILPETQSFLLFRDANDRTVLLLWGKNPHSLYRETLLAAEELKKALPLSVKGTVNIGIGNIAPQFSMIRQSYEEASEAVYLAALQGGCRILTYQELIGGAQTQRRFLHNWGKDISRALKLSDRSRVRDMVHTMMDSFRSGLFRVDEYRVTIQMTISTVLQTALEMDIPETQIISPEKNPFSEVEGFETLEEVEQWFLMFTDSFLASLEMRREDFSRAKVREARLYIEERYKDPQISLSMICKDLSVSTSYFSLIFKKHFGKTFIDYLTEVRIDKAKELLRNTNLKASEIAYKVGYQDPHYFSLIFRRAVGCPPSHFKTEGAYGV